MTRAQISIVVFFIVVAGVALFIPFSPREKEGAQGTPQTESPNSIEDSRERDRGRVSPSKPSRRGSTPRETADDAQDSLAAARVRTLLRSGQEALARSALSEIDSSRSEAVVEEGIAYAHDEPDELMACEAVLAVKKSGLSYASARLADLFRETGDPRIRGAIVAAFRFHPAVEDGEWISAMLEASQDEEERKKLTALAREAER
jgi:hypothetical protein